MGISSYLQKQKYKFAFGKANLMTDLTFAKAKSTMKLTFA